MKCPFVFIPYTSYVFPSFQGIISSWFRGAGSSGRLAVLAIPYYDMSPYTLAVYAGEPIKLTCNAYVPDTGHPDIPKGVSFTWQKNNKVLVNGVGEFAFKHVITVQILSVI